MFLTWLTPVGLQCLSRHWDGYDRAKGRGEACDALCTERQAHTKTNISVPRVSFCHLLLLSLYSAPPLPSLCVSHQRLFLWQTSSLCCLFDSRCQLLSTTVCVSPQSLSITWATDTLKGSSPVARPSCLTAKRINIAEEPFQRVRQLCSNVIKV